jgi:hypothetical protein
MESALVIGAVAEETHHHAVLMLALHRERRADRDRHASAHDAIRPQVAPAHVGNVHGAAASAAIARLLAEKLRKHTLRIRPFADAMAVAAVRGGDVVVIGERQCRANGARLLADGEVHGAVDQPTHVRLLSALLETPHENHLAQGFAQRRWIVPEQYPAQHRGRPGWQCFYDLLHVHPP